MKPFLGLWIYWHQHCEPLLTCIHTGFALYGWVTIFMEAWTSGPHLAWEITAVCVLSGRGSKYWGTFEPLPLWLRTAPAPQLTRDGHVSRQTVAGYLFNARKMLWGDFRQLSLARWGSSLGSFGVKWAKRCEKSFQMCGRRRRRRRWWGGSPLPLTVQLCKLIFLVT